MKSSKSITIKNSIIIGGIPEDSDKQKNDLEEAKQGIELLRQLKSVIREDVAGYQQIELMRIGSMPEYVAEEKEEKSKLILFGNFKKRSKITPKYSIFVSSVQKELEDERVTIKDLVENDHFLSAHYTSLLYEYEPAYSEKTLDGCLNALSSCQVYLLIVGVKYGTLVGEISITHREYRYAKEKDLPILVFIKGERNIGREQGTEALLREIESDDFKYKRFRNVIELKNEVNESLKKLLRDEEKFLKI